MTIHHVFKANRSRLIGVRQYLLSQAVTVACNLLYGLLCVRLLPPAEYAKFVVVFGVQGTLVILMDVGVTGSLIPLVGQRTDDRELIADYVASIRHIAQWLYVGLAACLVVGYPFLVRTRNWSVPVVASMTIVLLLSTWFVRVGATYGSVLILLQKRADWYRGQMASAVGTLLLLGCFRTVHMLGAFQAILINVVGIVFTGIFYFVKARDLLGTAGRVSRQKMRAVIRLTLPNIPGIVFYALQGQIALFLITLFGRTSGVASVGALSRLGQVFVLFTQMNMLLVEPFFARLPDQRLWKNYMGAVGITAALSLAVMGAACVFPELFLMVLGPSYRQLTTEVKLVVAASAVSYLTNVLWSIHSARRFIYWWSNIANIVLTLIVQIVFIVEGDLTSVKTVVWLNLATVMTAFITNSLSGFYGFLHGPRYVEAPTNLDAATADMALSRNSA